MARISPKKLLACLGLALLLPCLGWFARGKYDHQFNRCYKKINQRGFHFTSPLLDVELPEGYGVSLEPIPFKRSVESFVNQQISSGAVRKMSVYYRDLSDGPWFGINENVTYNPASMMKVPVMIAWLKRAEKDPSVLKRTFMFSGKAYRNPPQTIGNGQSIRPGGRYTVEELLRYMIRYSDNNAMSLLYFTLPPAEFADVVDGMDVTNEEYGRYDSISVHGYSGFLRILYNASFLSREMSEKALELMSRQEFTRGLRGGVPKGVVVASKFGEYNERAKPDDIQLHEFGIIYHPKGPYILGVLTRGNNWERQAESIRALSRLVYTAVDVNTPAAGGRR